MGEIPYTRQGGQTISTQRPFGCETEFTSRTKHHVTTISKNDTQR